MSLTIYTDMDKVNKKDFIMDVNPLIHFCGLQESEFVREVLVQLEEGQYYNSLFFLDRLGIKLPLDALSTSSRALICTDAFPDKIINYSEVGDNAGTLLMLLEKGNVFIPPTRIRFFGYGYEDKSIDVVINDVHCETLDEFTYYLQEVY